MKDDFVNLHCHSEFSLLDGMPRVDDYVDWVVEHGQPGIAITDHGAMGSGYALLKAASKAGIKGIVGIEAYIVPDASKHVKGERRSHVTLLAKSWKGCQNLFRLSTKGWTDGFYNRPRIQPSWLKEYSEDVICLSGCMDTMFGKSKDPLKLGMQMAEIFDGRFFMEIMPTKIDKQTPINMTAIRVANTLGLPLVATPDSHYLRDWQQYHKYYLGTGSKGKVWEFDDNCFHPMTRNEMGGLLLANHPYLSQMDIGRALDGTVQVCDMVDIQMPQWKSLTPQPYPGLSDDEEYEKLRELTYAGMDQPKWDGKRDDSRYIERLEYELNYIHEQGFVRYFLLIDDMLEFVRRSGIFYGPGRGSAGGSLVCAALRITDPDPVAHDLMFERFLAPGREEPPDIDLDFEDSRRQEIKDYLIEKYGEANVASMGMYGNLGEKMVMQDLARCMDIPRAEVNKASSLVTPGDKGSQKLASSLAIVTDILENTIPGKQLCSKYPDFEPACKLLLNRKRQRGVHASGVLVSPFPLTDAMPLDVRNGVKCSVFDGHECMAMGFLKLDILGIKTLSIIRETCDLSGITRDDLLALDYADPAILADFHEGKTNGVFQFNSQGMTGLLKEIPIDSFDDLVAVNALYRPGAMRSGLFQKYVDRRAGREEVPSLHPIYDEITKDTEGVLVYQEQIMLIFGQLGNYDPHGVDRMREMIKRQPGVAVFNKELPAFLEGATSHGMSEYDARNLFQEMVHFGSYAFNKSHAFQYTQIGYWCMWLKHYHPVEWYCALMNCEHEDDKFRSALTDAIQHGVKVFLPDINHSGRESRIVTNKHGVKAIKLGLTHIKGMGDKAVDDILEHKPYVDFDDLYNRVTRRVVNKRVQESVQVLGLLGAANRPWDEDYLTWRNRYPLPVNHQALAHLDSIAGYKEIPWTNIDSLQGKSGSVYVRGVITSVKKKNHDGKKSAVIQLNDSTGVIGVYIGGDILEEYGNQLKSGNSFFCRASKNSGNDDTLFAKKLIIVGGENNE